MSTASVPPPDAPANTPRADFSGSELLLVVYDELRRVASDKLKNERPGQTLSPTALVHEAYLRLVAAAPASRSGRWADKGQFLAAAAEAMRRILIENYRRRSARKRGGDLRREELHESQIAAPVPDVDLLELDEALAQLDARDPGKGTLVKLLYFVGLTIPEAAEVLGVSRATAERWWAYSRAWLFDRLQSPGGDKPE